MEFSVSEMATVDQVVSVPIRMHRLSSVVGDLMLPPLISIMPVSSQRVWVGSPSIQRSTARQHRMSTSKMVVFSQEETLHSHYHRQPVVQTQPT